MFSMTILCERPIPNVKRFPVAAAAVIACCASAVGWRGYVGVTAVPRPIRCVSRPTIDSVDIASKPKILAIQTLCNPFASTFCAKFTTPSMVLADPSAPIMTPIRISPPWIV